MAGQRVARLARAHRGPILPEHRPITLVTALLDIGRGKLDRPFAEHYLYLLERLLASDLPMVVYIAPEHEDFVWRFREPYNTRVVALQTSDLEALPWFDKVQDIRRCSRRGVSRRDGCRAARRPRSSTTTRS